MLKHQNGRSMLFGKLDNASTHQVREGLISMGDLAPTVYVVLLPFCDDASLPAIACDPSELFIPKAGYLLTTANEPGGKTRTFNSLDGADR